LYSTELAKDIFVNLKFRRGEGISLDDFSITFYFNDEAFEICRLLEEQLKKNKSV
jgi:hypothetical protein